MILPLGTDRPLRRPTLVNHALIGANLLAFVAVLLASRASGAGAEDQGPVWLEALLLDPQRPRWWQFVTYQFLHAGPLHLGGNLLFLWTFGPNVEDRLGRVGYFCFFVLGGACAGALHCLMSPHPVLGASGAIAAVTGAYLVLFPKTLIRVFILFFFIGVYQIPAGWFLTASIVWDMFFTSRGSNVAVAAHVGGYLFGMGVSLALLASGLLKREPFDLFSLWKHARRRREFKEITSKGSAVWTHQPALSADAPADPARAARTAARSEIEALARAQDPSTGPAYRRFLDMHGRDAAALAREPQLSLANLMFAEGERELAAIAYESFLARFPHDGETPRVRLMLGLIHARYLNDPLRAKALLREAKDGLRADDQRALADELLAELG